MDLPEPSLQSFVLRIWLEEHHEQQHRRRAVWRGHITDVVTGERHYLEDIEGIVTFLVPRLERMGVRIGLRWRIHAWLSRHAPE